MAALDRLSVASLGVSSDVSTAIFRKAAANAIWEWFEEHKEEVIFQKKIIFFTVKLKIGDLAFLIERITGTPRPV